jgi:hypothetical protein
MDRRWRLRSFVMAVVACSVGFACLAAAKTVRRRPAEHKPSTIKVMVELFQVALADDATVLYRRDERALDVRGPDDAVAALMPSAHPAIVHSTSWRFEAGGTVLLTYLAFFDGAYTTSTMPEASAIRARDLPRIGTTDPDHPRPPTLQREEVLAHGLRHLALLARRTGGEAFASRLGVRSRKFFSSIEPEVAGQVRPSYPSQGQAPIAPQ